MSDYVSKWHKELEIFEKIKPIIILEGNILDKYQYPFESHVQKGSILGLPEYLHYHFKDNGYKSIIFYDSIRGFYNHCEAGYVESFANLTGLHPKDGYIRAEFKGRAATAAGCVRMALTQVQEPSVIVMNFASRYITSPNNMEQSEVDSFTELMQSSLEGKDVRTDAGIRKNLLLLVVHKINDLPAWFYLDNPNVKSVMLGTPSREEREQIIEGDNFPSFFSSEIYKEDCAFFQERPDELEKIKDRFVALTEGFAFTELNGLRRLCKLQGIHVKDMCGVIDLYKFGIRENPWNAIDYEEIRNASIDFNKRIKGQENALTKTLDVVKRAITGMSGVQGSSHSRPKGVLFFAGPTGTGKTETAKALAEKLFGDESCCIRFDMSEYGQPHSDQRLLGAPPGYVGYEAGGQLTNRVKEKPFSILLFDEIEKAHPSILDKFLQILEDGRMTDGRGETVYFSETIIIFTSNLGIYKIDERGERVQYVSSDLPYEEVQERVRKGIEEYFKLQLGRPEILNRIGENIVVFDFIREDTAENILKAQIEKIIRGLQNDKDIILSLSEKAFNVLKEKAFSNLDNGARGIGNIVESLLINPLSRYMFDNRIFSGKILELESIDANTMPYSLICTVKDRLEV